MAYRVFWQTPRQILCIELEGDLTLDTFNQLNLDIVDHLDNTPGDQRILMIDITQPATVPRLYAQLKASQCYTMRQDLKFIVVVGSNKFMRLMMMLTFNLSRPALMFFDNMDMALQFAQKKQGIPSRNL